MRTSGYRWFTSVFYAILLVSGGLAKPCLAKSKTNPGAQRLPADRQVCLTDQITTIQSRVSCAASPGIALFAAKGEASEDEGWDNGLVQSACGPHGQITRLYAWKNWLRQLKEFEDQCDANGGEFSFADPGFKEPQNESFCYPAQLQKGFTAFEDPAVNVIAACPPQKVRCSYSCNADRGTVSQLMGSPPILLLEKKVSKIASLQEVQ